MDNKIKKHKICLISAVLCIFLSLSLFTIFKMYVLQSNVSELTFNSAKEKKQFCIEVRDGLGQFTIKPFKFKDIGSDTIKVYFKNEGRNEVIVSLFRINEDGSSDNEITELAPIGKGTEWVFNNPTDNEDDKFMLTLADVSEPLPVVIGEFYVTDN